MLCRWPWRGKFTANYKTLRGANLRIFNKMWSGLGSFGDVRVSGWSSRWSPTRGGWGVDLDWGLALIRRIRILEFFFGVWRLVSGV
jgi:hypothetical protein